MDTKNLMTYTEYAKKNGVSLKTVYNKIKAGAIIPIKVLGKYFIEIKPTSKNNTL